ncbi:hypothetical protein ACEYYB_04700 [Paracoccus sp. p4-l81]|uniref:bestrophin-like domain n=1 Tax=unclassified Paracoccus (in: a-proteobacteria) TaxID=2688777 RepID=UPI0035B99947
MNWLAYEHYAYAGVAVIGTLAAVWLVGQVLHSARGQTLLAPWHGVVPPFINIIGVLFGLTLAFIGNDTWSSRDRAMDAVFREGDGLRALLVLADTLPAPQGPALAAQVRGYGQALAAEWPALRDRRADPAAGQAADRLLAAIAAPGVAQAGGENVQQVMLAKTIEIRSERDLRVSLSRTHLNPLKWLGMAFLGLITILSIAAVHIGAPRAAMAAIWLFALAAAPSSAIVLVQGNPFQQPAAISPDPILAAIGGLQ